jgi:hypothetical protein
MKKVLKIIWGFKNFIFQNSYTPPKLNYILYRMAILTFNESHNYA